MILSYASTWYRIPTEIIFNKNIKEEILQSEDKTSISMRKIAYLQVIEAGIPFFHIPMLEYNLKEWGLKVMNVNHEKKSDEMQ